MKILDNRMFLHNDLNNLAPGIVIFYKKRYLLITDDPEIFVDLSTGELLESSTEVFDYQILNNVKLIIE